MKLLKVLKLGASLVVAALLTGCIEMSQEFTINEDKSADIVIEIGMSKQMVAMAEQSGEDPFDTETAKKGLEGKENIKSADVTTEERGDMKFMIMKIGVKDITGDLKAISEAMDMGNEDEEDTEDKDDEPQFTVLDNGNLEFVQKLPPPEDGAKEQVEMMKPMFEGKTFTSRIKGSIVSSNGTIASDKNSVEWKIPLLDLITGEAGITELKAEIGLGKAAASGGAKGGGAKGDSAKGGGALGKILPLLIIGLIVVALVVLGMSFKGKKTG